MSRTRFYVLGSMLFALFASSVAAQIYRWVDDKGTVHFSDERPRNQSGVEEVVEAGARRTPMVRGAPEWRVDTPTPESFDRTGRRDDFYDDEYYDEGPYEDAPRQGDTFIQVYEPPRWFDGDKHGRRRTWGQEDDHGRKRDGDQGRRGGGDHDRNRGERGRGDRPRDGRPPAVALPPPAPAGAPPAAQRSGRASSRAMPLPR